MSKQLITRGLVAVGLALVAVVLGLTQPMPAGAQTDPSREDGATSTTLDPSGDSPGDPVTDPFTGPFTGSGDPSAAAGPGDCIDRPATPHAAYDPMTGWTCVDSATHLASLGVDASSSSEDDDPAWVDALQAARWVLFGAAIVIGLGSRALRAARR